MFHQDSDNDIDKHKLCHQDEDDEEHRGYDGVDTTVLNTVILIHTIVAKSVLNEQQTTNKLN